MTDKSAECKEKSRMLFNKKSRDFYKTPEGIFSRNDVFRFDSKT